MEQTTITFESLTSRQKSGCQDAFRVMEEFQEFAKKVNRKLLMYLFGEERGGYHADTMYDKYRRNVFEWMNHLTSDEKGTLIANIWFNDTLYSHC